MTDVSLGYWCVHDTAVHASADLAGQVAGLLTDPRLPWQPSLVKPTQHPGRDVFAWPKGKVPATRLHDVVVEVLRSELTSGVHLATSRDTSGDHAWMHVDSGQPGYARGSTGTAYPFVGLAMCRGFDLPAGKTIDDWLAVMHELTAVLRAPHAVIWASDDERPIISRQYGVGSRRPEQPPDHPHNESVRVNQARDELGRRWIRPPAWGTYLRPEHVAAVGGRERIVDAVRPPVVRAVGELLYLQLSELVEHALTPDAVARQRALVELLAPIIVPPLQ